MQAKFLQVISDARMEAKMGIVATVQFPSKLMTADLNLSSRTSVFALPIVLVWCLVAAAVLALVPLALDYAVRHRNGLHAPSPLPLLIRVAAVLFVPVFFLWLNFVEDTLHVALPRIYVLPPR